MQREHNQRVELDENHSVFVLNEEQMAEFESNLEKLKVEANEPLKAMLSQPTVWS